MAPSQHNPFNEQILVYPDTRLRAVAAPVDEITPEVRARAEALLPFMAHSGGIGLAAPQVGWSVRLFVANVTGQPEDGIVLVNPKVAETAGGNWSMEEGCLSLPGIHGKVKRPRRVVFHATDLDGEEVELEAEGLVGRCLLHEFDHLDGVLFIDRLSAAKRMAIKRKLRVLEERAPAAV